MGEPVLFVPMTGGGHSLPPTADPGRRQTGIVAVIAYAPTEQALFSERRQGRSSIGQTRIASADAHASVGADVLATIAGGIREGDRLILTSRDGEPSFLVAEPPRPDEHGGVAFYLAGEGPSC